MKGEKGNWKYRFRQRIIVGTIAASFVIPGGALAGDHWLSRVTVETPGQPARSLTATQAATRGPASFASSSKAVFDITISLDSNPQGDDDSTADSGTSDNQQNAYEERIKEFANAVFQATNGAHKIGKVSIYRNSRFRKSADVTWDENCASDQGPRANPSGFGVSGKRIWMCSNWPGAATLMPTAKGAGYTLAHEWGHYTYGLFDEYAQGTCAADAWIGQPCSTDTASIPAIMNNQWAAAGGTMPGSYTGNAYDFLEYSTQNIHPFRGDSTGQNAQKRVYGESAWQTLTRDPGTDPKHAWLAPRTRYTALTAPSSPNWLVHNDESTAQSALDIRWVGNQVMDLLIDRSGSMDGAPLNNAKVGANLLIDQIQPGTAIGVASFESGIMRNYAITDIPNPDTGVKAAAKAAVNGIASANLTSLYDGLLFSLSGIQSFDPKRPGIVYVLSDGGDNDSSATESSVISAYQAAGVPIISFAYGSYAPTGTLMSMANATGGGFYQSPTTVAAIQAVLLAAESKYSSNVMIASSDTSAAASATTTRTIPLDSTLYSAQINLTYTGNPSDFDLSLLLPSGTNSGVSFVCQGSASCTATLDSAFFGTNGYGDYQVQMVNKTGTPKDVTVLVSGSPGDSSSYDISVGFSTSTVNYPADMAIRATVTKGPAITGLNVTAKVTGPNGTSDITLLDNGIGADLVANDGTYSASIPYHANGIYSAVVTASNASGNGQTTYQGVNISLNEDGTTYQPATESITANFQRIGMASTNATGVLGDDHANNPAGGSCTQIVDNNTDTAGRIDYAGDVDCFRFVPSSLTSPLVVRATSLTSGMNPVLTVYDHTGTNQLYQVDMATSESPTSGATLTISRANLDAQGHIFVIRHLDPSATTGGYKASAGVALASDRGPHTVTPQASQGGKLSPAMPQEVGYDETASFTVIPEKYYRLVSISGCGGQLSGNVYTTGPIIEDCTVAAEFYPTRTTASPSYLNISPASTTLLGGYITASWGRSLTQAGVYELELSSNGGDFQQVYRGTLTSRKFLAKALGRGVHIFRVRAVAPKYAPSSWVIRSAIVR